jgi:hypothetical protein
MSSGSHPSYVKKAQEFQQNQLPRLILPSTTIPYTTTAEHCFTELATTKKFFIKAGVVVELVSTRGEVKLEELEPTAFQSRLEQYFTLWRWIALPNGRQARIGPGNGNTESITRRYRSTFMVALYLSYRSAGIKTPNCPCTGSRRRKSSVSRWCVSSS